MIFKVFFNNTKKFNFNVQKLKIILKLKIKQ